MLVYQYDVLCGCGYYGVGQDLQGVDWKMCFGVVLVIGVWFCSGVIMILLFVNVLGIVSWGIVVVMSMVLGIVFLIFGLLLLVYYVCYWMVK